VDAAMSGRRGHARRGQAAASLARIGATLIVLVACLWGARWFANQAATVGTEYADAPLADAPAERRECEGEAASGSGALIDPTAADMRDRPPMARLLDDAVHGTAAGRADGIPSPPEARLIYSQGDSAASASALAVFSLAGSMPEAVARVARAFGARGWREVSAPPLSGSARCMLCFEQRDRTATVLLSGRASRDNAAGGDTAMAVDRQAVSIVVQIQPKTDERP
jgi:hypothetical protein